VRHALSAALCRAPGVSDCRDRPTRNAIGLVVRRTAEQRSGEGRGMRMFTEIALIPGHLHCVMMLPPLP